MILEVNKHNKGSSVVPRGMPANKLPIRLFTIYKYSSSISYLAVVFVT